MDRARQLIGISVVFVGQVMPNHEAIPQQKALLVLHYNSNLQLKLVSISTELDSLSDSEVYSLVMLELLMMSRLE